MTVINEDILKVDIAALAQEKNGGKPIKVVANLPYYITTPIIMGLFENHVPISSITIMVQKEVADLSLIHIFIIYIRIFMSVYQNTSKIPVYLACHTLISCFQLVF